MGGAAPEYDVPDARALARARQRAVLHGGLEGEADMGARGRFAQRPVAGEIARFLVGRQYDGVAEAVGLAMRLEGAQRLDHDRDAALHVGKAGAVELAVAEVSDVRKRAGRENRVVVPGQHDLHGRIRALSRAQDGSGMEGVDLALCVDRLDGRAVEQLHLRARFAQGVRNGRGERVQAVRIPATRIGLRPAEHALQHGVLPGVDSLQRGAIRCVEIGQGHAPLLWKSYSSGKSRMRVNASSAVRISDRKAGSPRSSSVRRSR